MGGARSKGLIFRAVGTLAVPAALWATAAAAVTPGTAGLGAPGAIVDGLSITGTGTVMYDSNVLRSTAPSLLNGGHQDDFRYSPSGTLTYNRGVGLLSVSATGLAGYDFFQYNSRLDRKHFGGSGSVTYRTGSGCQAVVNGNYSSRQNGIGTLNPDAIGTSSNPDSIGRLIDNVQDSALYGINANCGSPSGRLSFGGGYVHSSVRNASPLRRFVDSDDDTFSGNVGVGILRPGQIGITGSYSTIGYPNRLAGGGTFIPPQFLTSGVKTYRVGLTLSRPIGTRLSGVFGISYLHADPVGNQAPYSSPAYNAALTYNSSSRLTLTLTGARSAIASSGAGALYRIVDQVVFDANYSLGETISLNANLGLVKNNYQQSFAIPGEPARNNEATKTAAVNVTYSPRSLFDVTLGVSHAMRNSDPAIFNYNSTKATLALSVHI